MSDWVPCRDAPHIAAHHYRVTNTFLSALPWWSRKWACENCGHVVELEADDA